MTTVTAVKRALEETLPHLGIEQGSDAIIDLLESPTALTILANRLSDRGKAGNEAARRNLGDMKRIAADLRFTAERVGAPGCQVRLEAADKLAALEWGIEQLTPPELALKATESPALYLQQMGRFDRATGKIKPVEASPDVCDLGVGCEEYGVCYAAAHGQPDRCGRKP